MQKFTLENGVPEGSIEHRKTATVRLLFMTEPFLVETQEGLMEISSRTVDNWDGGYYVAFPSDGSKPYSIAPSFVHENYVPVETASCCGV